MKKNIFIFGAVVIGIVSTTINASAYLADINTGTTSGSATTTNHLWLLTSVGAGDTNNPTFAANAAPVGTKMWFVADVLNNGVPTAPLTVPTILGVDDVLISEVFVDGTLLGVNNGKFRQTGLSVSDTLSNATIYVYLWNTSSTAENLGDKFGLFNVGVVNPPAIGNAFWGITGDIFADTFTVGSAVPEPSAIALAGVGALGLLVIRRRKQ